MSSTIKTAGTSAAMLAVAGATVLHGAGPSHAARIPAHTYPMIATTIVRTAAETSAPAMGKVFAGERVQLYCYNRDTRDPALWAFIQYHVDGTHAYKAGWIPDSRLRTRRSTVVPGVQVGNCPAPTVHPGAPLTTSPRLPKAESAPAEAPVLRSPTKVDGGVKASARLLTGSWKAAGLSRASDLLDHYLDNVGTDYQVNTDEIIGDLPRLEAKVRAAATSQWAQRDTKTSATWYMNTESARTTSTVGFEYSDYDVGEAAMNCATLPKHPWKGCGVTDTAGRNRLDWMFAIGQFDPIIKATVTPELQQDDRWKLTISYTITVANRYDFPGRWFAPMRALAEAGLAKTFMVRGVSATHETSTVIDRTASEAVAMPPLYAAVVLESVNYPGLFLRQASKASTLSRLSPNDRLRFVPGLAGEGVSLESVRYPGHYLRHQDFTLKPGSTAPLRVMGGS